MDLSTIGVAFKAITLVARTRISKFPAAQGAVAAVEFALIMPLLLFLYIGSNELSEAISADRRVTLVSSTIGDLVARANGTLLWDDLNDYFTAADSILFPLPIGPLEQIITSVSVDAKGGATVVWSKRRDGSDGHAVGSSYKLPDEVIAAATRPEGSYVIVSEASYSYEPLAGLIFKAAVPLYHRSFFIPRFGGNIRIVP